MNRLRIVSATARCQARQCPRAASISETRVTATPAVDFSGDQRNGAYSRNMADYFEKSPPEGPLLDIHISPPRDEGLRAVSAMRFPPEEVCGPGRERDSGRAR